MKREAEPLTPYPSRLTSLASIALSCAILLAVFTSLLQYDIPLARFLRSIHPAWLGHADRLGYWLGSGLVLVAISGTILGLGIVRKSVRLRQAGLLGLIAHAAAGLTVQLLKHLIGRPRPRFLHAGGFQIGPLWGPSLESGLDSFPSGHTAASLAVAGVMARHFPAGSTFFYAVAGLVAVSRVTSGSHFPTDVLAGATVGMLAGHVASRPLAEWRVSVREALSKLAISMVGIFAFLWVMVHSPEDGWLSLILIATGLVAVAGGIFLRLYRCFPSPHASRLTPDASRPTMLIAMGVALTTGSLWVTALMALAVLAVGLAPAREGTNDAGPLYRDLLYAAVVAVTVVLIQAARGVLPLL